MKKECPVCAELIDEHAQVCPYCNEKTGFEPQPPQKECPICGEMIDEVLSVCPICGEDISQIIPTKPKSDSQQVDEPASERNTIVDTEPAPDLEQELPHESLPEVEPEPESELEPLPEPEQIVDSDPTQQPTSEPVSVSRDKPAIDKQPSSHRNNILLYIIIALLVVIIGVLVVFLLTRGSDQSPTTDAIPAKAAPQRVLTIPEKLDSIAAELPADCPYYDVFPDEQRQCIYYLSDNQLYCQTVYDEGYVMPIPLKYQGYEVEVMSASLKDDGNTIEMDIEATNGSKATCLLNTLTGITQMIPKKKETQVTTPMTSSTSSTNELQKPVVPKQESKPQSSTPKPSKQQEPEEDVAPANSNSTGWHFEKVDNMPNTNN